MMTMTVNCVITRVFDNHNTLVKRFRTLTPTAEMAVALYIKQGWKLKSKQGINYTLVH